MRQRVPGRAWYSPGRPGHRPRVLIEDDHPALAISDFSLFQQAGFDVAYCSGPGGAAGNCPLLRGQRCVVLDGADAVLHGLDPRLGIAAAIRRQHPGIAVVTEQRHDPDGGPDQAAEGCAQLTFASSVPGQVDALRRELARRRG